MTCPELIVHQVLSEIRFWGIVGGCGVGLFCFLFFASTYRTGMEHYNGYAD